MWIVIQHITNQVHIKKPITSCLNHFIRYPYVGFQFASFISLSLSLSLLFHFNFLFSSSDEPHLQLRLFNNKKCVQFGNTYHEPNVYNCFAVLFFDLVHIENIIISYEKQIEQIRIVNSFFFILWNMNIFLCIKWSMQV